MILFSALWRTICGAGAMFTAWMALALALDGEYFLAAVALASCLFWLATFFPVEAR